MKFILALFFFTTSLCFGQLYNFENFQEDQLNANFFYDFDQSSNGELYIASSKGLINYNGFDFKIYNEQDSLIDEFVNKIFVDSKDNIWLSYYKGGLSFWPKNKSIEHIDSNLFVYDIFENDKNEIFISAERGAFKVVDKKLEKNKTYKNAVKIDAVSANVQLLLSEENNLYFLENGKKSVFLDSAVVDFSVSPDGYPFFYYKSDRISIYSKGDDGLPHYEESFSLKELAIESDITSITMSKRKAIIGTEKNGLFEVYLNPGYQSFSIQNFTLENGIGVEKINCLFLDREKNLWIGSYGDGISMIPNKRISRHALSADRSENQINKIEYFKGELIIGTGKGLRYLKDSETPFIKGFEEKSIHSLKTKGDTLWVGTNNGLYYLHNNKVEKLHFPLLRQQPRHINSIQFDGNSIFVGTNNGLFSYDFETQNALLITNADGLAHNVIEHFIIDRNRTFWFDSPNSPIYSYNGGEFTYHKNIEGFNSFNLTEIIEKKNGEIWFGTSGDGLFVYKNGDFHSYTSSNSGLFSDYIYFLNETKDDKIICGHKSSLTIIETSTKELKFNDIGYTRELEYILPKSNYISASNYQWIGTYKGAVRIPEINKTKSKYIPDLVFEGIKINEQSSPLQKEYFLPYGRYFIEIDFSANYLLNAKSVQFECKLDGFDQDWTTINFDESNIRYQSLTDGEYNFKVKLLLNGKETEKSLSLKIVIEKPYWKTTWFYILIVLLVIFSIITSIILTNRRNKKIKIQLKSEVKKRTADLVKKNEEVALLSDQYLDAKNNAEYKTAQIEESITYARYIQKVLLRRKDYAEWISSFESFFLVFKPKDLVSGDFYWGYKKDDYAYVAVADCTGHGVPGAMISMLGASFLNDSIHYLNDTNELLESLRSRVIEGFDQDADSQLSDGMDICLMRLNTKTNQIQFSGAMNPIFIVREKKNDPGIDGLTVSFENEELVIYTVPADKQPIGYYYQMSPFTKIEFTLQKDDQIYLLSDGYVDQFGGPNYKKFMRKNLFIKFFEIYHLTPEEQKNNLWSTMESWMGDYEQIDDISIIGIKI